MVELTVHETHTTQSPPNRLKDNQDSVAAIRPPNSAGNMRKSQKKEQPVSDSVDNRLLRITRGLINIKRKQMEPQQKN